MVQSRNIKANDLKKIKRMVDDNTDIIIKHWELFFKEVDNESN